jgi:iron complex outermembrane receptor protein
MNKSQHLNTPSQRKAIAVAVSAALTGGTQAFAQGTNALEEVIVTATKRSVNMQDLPQSIQAFTTEDIQRRGFVGIDDYSKQIPGLSVARREPGGTSVVFRGVASSGLQFGANPSSSLYLDEQPITTAGRNPNPRLIDIARVEALSGPQGTLFGDSSQSGTLRVITNKASTEKFEAWIDAGGNSVEDGDTGYDVSAMVNMPLGDKVALRLVGFTSQDAGYVDNVLTTSQGGTFDNASQVQDDINEHTTDGARLNLRWDVSDDWTLDVMGIFQNLDVDGYGDVNTDKSDLQQGRFGPESMSDDWYQVGLTLEGKLGWADTTIAASYFKRDFKYEADNTDYLFEFNKISSYYPYYSAYEFGGDPTGFALNEGTDKRWSVEARLTTPSDSDSRWSGLLGVFYSKSKNDTLFQSSVTGLSDSPGGAYLAYLQYYYSGAFPSGPTDNWFFGQYDSEIETTAVFGEVTFDVTDNLTITAGGRWYDVKRDDKLFQGGLMQGKKPEPTDLVLFDEESDEGDSGFVPKVNVTYTLDDSKLIYATYSEGFRSGGGNTVRRISVIPRKYDSDTLKNYEVGAKTEWLDGSLRLNVTGYFMQWEDIQIQANDPQPTVFSLGTINFPEAEISGVEMDFAWATPIDGLTIDGSYAYLSAELSKDATVFAETGFPIDATDGTDLPISPEWKAAVGIEYMFQGQLFGGDPHIRLDYSHIDDSVNALEGLESIVFAPAPTVQEAYDTWDLRAGVDWEGISATFYVKNLDDERGELFFNNRWGKQRLSITQPRTFGFAVRKYFD